MSAKGRHCKGKISSNVNSPKWNHQVVKMWVEVKKRWKNQESKVMVKKKEMMKYINKSQVPRNPALCLMMWFEQWCLQSMDDCPVNLSGGCLCSLWGSKSRFPPVGLGREMHAHFLSSPAPGGWSGAALITEASTRHQNKTGLKVFLNPNDTFRWGIYLIYYLQRKYFLISFPL